MNRTAVENISPNITKSGELLRTQQTSPVDLVSACLRRIEEWNPRLNAFITVLSTEALEQARLAEAEFEAGHWRGPLHGIPVGIKDFYDTAGTKTTAGFDRFKDRVPERDAVVVTTLKHAGAIIIGKTNMHILGMGTSGLESYFGPVRNPWNPEHIPGGSSSGSAAAVASGMCYATVDTDAIGSCRLPAACCGVVGFKGTYGLINPQGILEGEEDPGEMIRWFNHPGIMTRAVEDTALMLDVLATNHEGQSAHYFDAVTQNRRIRIGVPNNFRSDQGARAAFDKAVELISGLGHPISSVAVPLRIPMDDLSMIESDRAKIADRVFQDVDALLLPTTATVTPAVKDARNHPEVLSAENTVFANYYGLPALSVPCGFDRNGLPLGIGIVGKPWNEVTVLQLAHQYEKAAAHKPDRGA